ncbi:hypothetical protein I7I50_09336 [Histoplasma capsulatum G186AR]|uniref:Transmembrane protein n=1 Tax=Ajellomyces capsulatus TaxID=5037 RepID=A0A8H7YPT0_AJECA|nr:hypothetical protein I7I52_06857 [Histoplasma capsulatum]QSS74241.1 hypothetical protein I7I50_09336 [Histoplasma capsulatum G186AR]
MDDVRAWRGVVVVGGSMGKLTGVRRSNIIFVWFLAMDFLFFLFSFSFRLLFIFIGAIETEKKRYYHRV